MRFFVSDTHFGHKNIIQYCNRPFKDVDHMNEVLIKNWNDTVGPDDEVFVLGDVALGSWEKWDGILSRLMGHKHLIIGNHDKVFAENKESYRNRFMPVYEQWFETIQTSTALDLSDGSHVLLSHFPFDGDSHDEDRHSRDRLCDCGCILLHGHTHSNEKVSRSKHGSLQIHVGVDAWMYKPVSEDEVIRLINTTQDANTTLN